jgi:hypothetical protein
MKDKIKNKTFIFISCIFFIFFIVLKFSRDSTVGDELVLVIDIYIVCFFKNYNIALDRAINV